MNQLYREQLLDHYNNPRNFGSLDGSTHSASLANLSCGDKIVMHLKVDNGKIKNIKFEGEGCAICIASASMLTEEMLGKDIEYAKNFKYEDLEEMIGIELTPSRIKCAHLGLLALQKALK